MPPFIIKFSIFCLFLIEITSEADLFHIVRHSFSFFGQESRHEHNKVYLVLYWHTDCAIKLNNAAWVDFYIHSSVRDIVYGTGGEGRINKVVIHLLLTDYEIVHFWMTTVIFSKLK